MRTSRQNSALYTLLAIGLLWLGIVAAAPPEKVTVSNANPNSALQGEALDVVISGSGFDHGSTVKFLVSGTKDDTQITVNAVALNADGTLTASIQVQGEALVTDYDIEVRASSGRRGKGTTLFSVQFNSNGGGAGVNTSAIPLVCSFADAPGDSFLSDGLGHYHDNVDRAMCTTGDSQETKPASHIRFYSFASGNVRRAIRKMDFVIDESTCTNPAGCAIAPDGFFEATAIGDMEDGRFWVRAYDGELGAGVEPHIQNLPPDATYQVTMGFDVLGTAQRWSFHLRSLPLPEADGLLCGQADPTPALGDDVTLYTWPDDDLDSRPDGYTFTTAPALDLATSPPTPLYDGGDPSLNMRTATLCSNVGIDGSGCGGPGGSDLCHVISQMEVQFTWHAEVP